MMEHRYGVFPLGLCVHNLRLPAGSSFAAFVLCRLNYPCGIFVSHAVDRTGIEQS